MSKINIRMSERIFRIHNIARMDMRGQESTLLRSARVPAQIFVTLLGLGDLHLNTIFLLNDQLGS
jgi:hypothetical protein